MRFSEKEIQLLICIYSGWSYWQFKKYQDLTTTTRPATAESFYTEDGQLQITNVRALSRSYVQAIAGRINQSHLFHSILFLSGQPMSMSFDPITSRFQLVFNINTTIQQPTIVYINQELNYPHGFDINVSPNNTLTWNSSERNYYEFSATTSTKNGMIITIFITAKTLN